MIETELMIQMHIAALGVHQIIPVQLKISIKPHSSAGVFHWTVRLVLLLNFNSEMYLRNVTETAWAGSAKSVLLLVWEVITCIPNVVPRVRDPKNS
jgi:hypothetical protein